MAPTESQKSQNSVKETRTHPNQSNQLLNQVQNPPKTCPAHLLVYEKDERRKDLTYSDWVDVFDYWDEHPKMSQMAVVKYFLLGQMPRAGTAFIYFSEDIDPTSRRPPPDLSGPRRRRGLGAKISSRQCLTLSVTGTGTGMNGGNLVTNGPKHGQVSELVECSDNVHQFVQLLLGTGEDREALGTIQDAATHEYTLLLVEAGSIAEKLKN
ncbi:hypothetical protein B0H14DRAFT_2655481 [Mycena olivaceomarginata]|nr:hypothetical protein B0H14DRAFT_2655481 [Mycena olivaceomarginata]